MKLRLGELLLLALGLVLTFGSATLQLGGISLASYWLGDEDKSAREKMGRLASLRGSLVRQFQDERVFQEIKAEAELFAMDLVFTGPESFAELELTRGARIILGPEAMIRLTSVPRITVAGVYRMPAVQVIAGKVSAAAPNSGAAILMLGQDRVLEVIGSSGSAAMELGTPVPITPPPPAPLAVAPIEAPATPEPSPQPIAAPAKPVAFEARLVAPQEGAELTPSLEEISTAGYRTELRFQTTPPSAQVELRVRKLGRNPREVFSKQLEVRSGKGSVPVQLEGPGDYDWEVVSEGDKSKKKLTRARFKVRSELEAIKMLKPRVGGQEIDNNLLIDELKKDFAITLRWSKIPEVNEYQVKIGGDRPKTVTEESIVLNRGKVPSGRLQYEVRAKLPGKGGFAVTSGKKVFAFNFLPPQAVSPVAEEVAATAEEKNFVLTWRSTNFTDAYEVEVATEDTFAKPVFAEKTTYNFATVGRLPAGRYAWRVRGLTGEVRSPFSKPAWFRIGP